MSARSFREETLMGWAWLADAGRMVIASWALAGTCAMKPDPGGPEFDQLLSAAQADPERADFRRLRLAYTRSPGYAPYEPDELDTAALDQEVANGERVAGLLALDRMMDGHWLDMKAHLVAARACARFGEEARAELHARFARGLVLSILDSGDGRTFETAWPVIDVSEEYDVLLALGLGFPQAQELVQNGGHEFDVITVSGPVEGREMKLYFNIDVPRQWLARTLAAERPDRQEDPEP
jgi:hypothetical protein